VRAVATTLLDALGLLLVAAGAGLATAGMWRQAAVGVSGVVVLAGSQVASRMSGRPNSGSR
jgi:hypothetical protein